MRRLVVGSLLAMIAGCSNQDAGYAVDLTLVVDTNVSTAQIATLRFSVSGVENDTRDVGVVGKFTNREETLRYKPGATTSGTLDFGFVLLDGSGATIANGAQRNVTVQPGTYQRFRVSLSGQSSGDLAVPGDMNRCGNGTVEPDESCDPASPSGCPTSVADCDDHNACTTDSFSGAGCQARCTHTAANDTNACVVTTGDAGVSGVCLNGQCCTGCIKNGQCRPGNTNTRECGNGGNDCFDCTQSSASATCDNGTCSGCDATSCAADGRTCGTSSCGYNCGGCPDACSGAGVVTKYACVNKTCQMNGGGNCGLYAACASNTQCKSTCVGDNDCVASAWCDTTSMTCKPKQTVGSPCSAESTGDHECASPLVCTWLSMGTSAICAALRCTGCSAITPDGMSCSRSIVYGRDPRNACPYVTLCNDGVCAGRDGRCALANEGPLGQPKPCGATTCVLNQGIGQLTGAVCDSTGSCGQRTVTCAYDDGMFSSYFGCNASFTGCEGDGR